MAHSLPHRAPRTWTSRASQALLALALLLLIGHFLVYVHYAIGLLRFPFDYDQGEGFELVDTIMLSHGDWPYRNADVYPFYSSNYPPLFHVILVPCVWIFGNAYWYGRLTGFLGTLITASTIGWIVYREEQQRTVAALAGLAFLASNTIYHVGPLFRQHMTMVMFETLSVAVLAHAGENTNTRQRRRRLAVGLLLLLAAGYTKQLALASSVAVFGFLMLRNPRRCLAWGVLFAAAAGALFFWIDRSTGGAWWTNIIAANVNEYYPAQFVGLFKQWFRLHGILIVLAALFALYELYFARLSLYTVWWVLAVGDTVLSGKWGAGDSYFATAIAATCVLSGLFAARSVRGTWHFPDNYLTRWLGFLRRPMTVHARAITAAAELIVPLLYLGYGLSVVKLPTQGAVFGPLSEFLGLHSSYGDRYAFYDAAGWTPGYATIGHVPTQADIDHGWQIVDRLRASSKPALSEEAGFSLRAGKEVVTNPTQLKNLYENGLFDPAPLVAAIQAQDFGVVVFRAQFYPPPVLDAVYEAYYPADVIPMNGFNYELWQPGPPQAQRSALAAALLDLEPGSRVEQPIDLPPDAAALWLAHALAYHTWTVLPDAASPAPAADCQITRYGQAERVLEIELCPAGDQARVTLRMERE